MQKNNNDNKKTERPSPIGHKWLLLTIAFIRWHIKLLVIIFNACIE